MTAARAQPLRGQAWPLAALQALFAGLEKRATGAPELTTLRAWAASALEPTLTHPDSALPDPREPLRCTDHRNADSAADDWDNLFAAVADRLCQSVAEPPTAGADLRTAVTECLQALTLLQALRARERGDGRVFEDRLRRANDALAAAHVDLVQARLGERRANHGAQHERLTALPNRDSFSTRLNQALIGNGPEAPALAVLFLDLDGFKPIYDRHGHATGDELLRIVASRLSRSVRKHDLVCQLGSDEFACVLSEPRGREQLSQLAAKLFDAVSAPLKVGSLQLSVRPSIGIALCPSDGDTAATLLKRADAALVRAKQRQLGFAFFDRRADS